MANGDTFDMCGRCGAVTGFVPAEGGGFDNSERHREWHRKLDEYLAHHDATLTATAKFARSVAVGLGAPIDPTAA